VHILGLCALRGLAVRGPMIGRQHAYVLVRDWLGPRPCIDRDQALAELARRYLAGHAPADEADLARWAGLPLRDARAGLKAIGRELVERDDGLLEPRRSPRPRALPPPRLLGPFEPVLLGWRSRRFIVGEHEAALIKGGMFSAFAMVEGRAVATWGIRDGSVWIEPFTALGTAERAALEADGRAALDYLRRPGDPRQV